MQNLDLKKILTGEDTHETNPVFNDRFEIRDLVKTSNTSKIYAGYDLVTDNDIIIKYRQGRAREQFVDGYSYIDEDGVPPLIWEETLGPNHVLIYEKKGLDVQTLFKNASNHFSPITTAMIFHLSVCALEKIHSKKIIHTNLKPSKLVTNNEQVEHRIYLTGLEYCERISRVISKTQKSPDIKPKKAHENIFSSINAHQGHTIGYRDDLEALGYIICNFFSDGKLFGKYEQSAITDGVRKVLIKQKSNIRAEPLLTNMPSEFSDYFKYLQKLKIDDIPDYEHLRTLSFKLCQKVYVKTDIVSCLDWVTVSEDQKGNYRAKMLSYFFCNTTKNTKKMRQGTVEDILFNQKKRPAHVTKALVQHLQPDDYFKKNFQNMPILETQEEQNATKYYLDGFQLDLDEEYSSCPTTPRLATKDKVFISKNTKMDKFRPPTTEEGKVEIQMDKFRQVATEEVKVEIQQETMQKQKTTSSSSSVDSVKSLEESKVPTRQVPVSVPKTHQGILMSLTLNSDERAPVNKRFEVLTASKSLSQTHLKEFRSQLSVPGSKPEKQKLIQK